MYRTCLVLSGIQKKNALDDVFWMAVYNLCLSDMEGDMDRFYEVRCPQRFSSILRPCPQPPLPLHCPTANALWLSLTPFQCVCAPRRARSDVKAASRSDVKAAWP